MINILNKRGESHEQHCEDSIYYMETESKIIGVVLDGCSTGIDSWFASKLYSVCFKQALTQEVFSHSEPIYNLLKKTIPLIYVAQKQHDLENIEMLSTVVVFSYDKDWGHLSVRFVGDGAVYTNELFEIDQNNQPNYLQYHIKGLLDKRDLLDIALYNKWYDALPLYEKDCTAFSVCSDGISSFRNGAAPNTYKNLSSVVDFLLKDDFLKGNRAELKRKVKMLHNDGWSHYDDLTIFRYRHEAKAEI